MTRVIPADGRSRAYVNGRPATVATLAELTDGVIDLHGQHAHQSLLSGVAQRAALDAFGSIDLAALRAARDGAAVALCARRRERLDEVAAAVRRAGGEALPIVADVTSETDTGASVGNDAVKTTKATANRSLCMRGNVA